MRLFFEQNRCLTSPTETRERLLVAHKVSDIWYATAITNFQYFIQWLEAFKAAKSGDERMQAVLRRYNSMIATKRAKERMKSKLIDAFVSQS